MDKFKCQIYYTPGITAAQRQKWRTKSAKRVDRWKSAQLELQMIYANSVHAGFSSSPLQGKKCSTLVMLQKGFKCQKRKANKCGIKKKII